MRSESIDAFSAVLSTEGRVAGLCWANSNLNDLKDSLRAICTVLLDPRDPLLQSERTQGFAADPVYVRAKCLPMLGSLTT